MYLHKNDKHLSGETLVTKSYYIVQFFLKCMRFKTKQTFLCSDF